MRWKINKFMQRFSTSFVLLSFTLNYLCFIFTQNLPYFSLLEFLSQKRPTIEQTIIFLPHFCSWQQKTTTATVVAREKLVFPLIIHALIKFGTSLTIVVWIQNFPRVRELSLRIDLMLKRVVLPIKSICGCDKISQGMEICSRNFVELFYWFF